MTVFSSHLTIVRIYTLFRRFAKSKLATPRDIPLRAKSVCLSERPPSRHERNIKSADSTRRYGDKQYITNPPQNQRRKSKIIKTDFQVKHVTRKIIPKTPCALSIQTLTIPMKYADHKRSTSKSHFNTHLSDKAKSSNPKQVGENKRLCEKVGCGTETENKLLVQISEANQVSDFERILNSNAIVCERPRHVWRNPPKKPRTASVLPRPYSAYRLQAINQTYHYYFKQHEDTLQSIIDEHRKSKEERANTNTPEILIERVRNYEDLHVLSQFYQEDPALRAEIETITDRIVAEEVRVTEELLNVEGKSNVNVNLAGLIGLQVVGESFSPVSPRDDCQLSPELIKDVETDGKEWLPTSMSSNPDDSQQAQVQQDVDRLSQALGTVKIDNNAKVPTITFSNCCDGCNGSDHQNSPDVLLHLSVPSIESVDETRPPIM